ncbi:MAG: patatin-like phospholipase family protein [Panacagrimonas sp.]
MDIAAILSSTPLAALMPEATRQILADLAEPLYLHSGESLYREGEPPDYCYVVLSGRLRVMGHDSLIGHVGYGEVVGEAGAITGEPRSSTVVALRDSIVVRLPRDVFVEFLLGNAAAGVALSRMLVTRLRAGSRERRLSAEQGQCCFAVFPASPSVPAMTLAETLARGLSGWPVARVITSAHVDASLGPGTAQTPYEDIAGSRRLMEWFGVMERRHRYLICVADAADDAWALRCLRQADRVLAIAEADVPPRNSSALAAWRGSGSPQVPVELVLLRAEADPAPYTLAWQQATGARAHYYVHPWDQQELAALRRQITGRGIGLVLGGGGARGFAHIGLLRALEQLQIPVDVAGGTSMGAFVSALAASGFSTVEMAQIARETFVENNYLNDYVLPRFSLIRARKFLGRLREIFGERQIEELRRSYFCISTNLSSGAIVVHDRGPLAEWVGTSMSVPGVAPPIAWQGDLLCDGGVVDNLPTDIMQGLERGTILACGVSAEGDIRAPGAGMERPDPEALMLMRRGAVKLPRFSEILLRTATLNSDTVLRRAAVERADIYVGMPVQGIGMFDWKRLDELIDLGYEHALRQLTPLRDALVQGNA